MPPPKGFKVSEAGSGSQLGFDRRGFKEDDPAMRRQAVRTISLMLAVLIGLAAPARAATITFTELVRTVGASGQLRPASEVRLRLGVQSGSAAAQNGPAQGAGASSSPQQTNNATAQQQTSTPPPATPDQTLSQGGGQVQTVDLGDVTGTVCDCGEIPVAAIPKGGFPWWPLLGVPLVCVTGICSGGKNTPPECVVGCNNTPTPPGVPEPATLLLFGSGLLALGARARRRHGRKQLEEATAVAATEEA